MSLASKRYRADLKTKRGFHRRTTFCANADCLLAVMPVPMIRRIIDFKLA